MMLLYKLFRIRCDRARVFEATWEAIHLRLANEVWEVVPESVGAVSRIAHWETRGKIQAKLISLP